MLLEVFSRLNVNVLLYFLPQPWKARKTDRGVAGVVVGNSTCKSFSFLIYKTRSLMPNSLGAIVRIEPDQVRKSPEILPERSFTSFIRQAFIEDICALSTPRHLVLLSPALHAKACNLFPHSCNVLTKGSNCHGPFYSRGFWSKENIYWRNRVSYVISPFKIICYFKRSVFLHPPQTGCPSKECRGGCALGLRKYWRQKYLHRRHP